MGSSPFNFHLNVDLGKKKPEELFKLVSKSKYVEGLAIIKKEKDTWWFNLTLDLKHFPRLDKALKKYYQEQKEKGEPYPDKTNEFSGFFWSKQDYRKFECFNFDSYSLGYYLIYTLGYEDLKDPDFVEMKQEFMDFAEDVTKIVSKELHVDYVDAGLHQTTGPGVTFWYLYRPTVKDLAYSFIPPDMIDHSCFKQEEMIELMGKKNGEFKEALKQRFNFQVHRAFIDYLFAIIEHMKEEDLQEFFEQSDLVELVKLPKGFALHFKKETESLGPPPLMRPLVQFILKHK